MTDEIERLRAEMARATPTPDPVRRAENLRLATKNFDALQGTPDMARPTEARLVWGRLADGVTKMIDRISRRGAMIATTALVAVGAFVVLPTSTLMLQDRGSEHESL
ncbi:MAG: VWA domain-containing protein, partial [Pseudomonadota bacterium]